MLKRTTEEAAEYFKEHGCRLIGEYVGAMIPMEYQCSCGRLSKISWNNFTKGKRCGWCKKRRVFQYNLEEVKEMFREKGCELLVEEYNNNKELLLYRCKCGDINYISFSALINNKQHCKKCGIEKYRLSRTKPESKLYKKLRYKYSKALKRTLEALKLNKNDYSHVLLGYTAKNLQKHIESHINWDSVKDGDWELDHIFPIIAFIKRGINDIKLINCLQNLRPLSRKDNQQKGDTYDEVGFDNWLLNHQFKLAPVGAIGLVNAVGATT